MSKTLSFRFLLASFILSMVLLTNAQAYTQDIILPYLNKDFYREAAPTDILSAEYAGGKLPITSITPGNSVRIKMLAPPGITNVGVGATSNFWEGNGPGRQIVFGIFETDPGEICVGGNTQGCVLPDRDLHATTAEMSEKLSRTTIPDDQPFYAYLILYNPPTSNNFTFGAVNFTFFVKDGNKYNDWRNVRLDPATGNINPDVTAVVTTSPASVFYSADGRIDSNTKSAIEFDYGKDVKNVDDKQLVQDVGDISVAVNQSFTLKANVTVDTSDAVGDVEFFIIAKWTGKDAQGNLVDVVQFKTPSLFFNAWTEPLLLNPAFVPPYQVSKLSSSSRRVELAIGSGILQPLPVLAAEKKLTFIVGYKKPNGSFVIRLSAPFIFTF